MATLHDLRLALEHLRRLPVSLWLDFRPSHLPVVGWDGTKTVLLQADSAPSGDWSAGDWSAGDWAAGDWADGDDAWFWEGRHPSMVAHTAVTLEGGLEAAALLLDDLPDTMTVPDLAALVAHEALHVYQATHAAGWPERWQADELAVFGYPLTAPLLATRRLETSAFRRALADPEHWHGHAAEALHWRQTRHTLLSAAQQNLERALERVEGLAHHVELTVTGQSPSFPQPDFPAEAIRLRCYSTGAALAQLLDRSGDWKTLFMSKQQPLDATLAERLRGVARTAQGPEAVEDAKLGAEHEARRVQVDRKRAEQDFLTQPGPRLLIRSALPLWPRGFDPQNITELEGGMVLHRRFLGFGNLQVSGEVLGRAALTSAAGAHPLLHGFSSIVLTGLNDLQRSQEGGTLCVRASGFELQISGNADLHPSPEGWSVTLP